MRLPKIENYDTSSNKTTITLGKLEFSRYFYNLGHNKDRDKFIKTVEKLVRSSLEYRDLINYLKTKMGMNFCSFFHKISKDNFSGYNRIGIEIHHEPFTLYDIVSIILQDHIKNKPDWERVDVMRIAQKTMRVHYEGIVGLIPLSTTVHELVHSGKIFIPLQFIDEGFNTFFVRYKDSIKEMDGLKDMLKVKMELSKEFEKDPDQFISILKKKYIYVVNEGYTSIPDKIED